METFASALLAICAGLRLKAIHRSPVNSPHKRHQMPVTRSFDVFFDLRLTE